LNADIRITQQLRACAYPQTKKAYSWDPNDELKTFHHQIPALLIQNQ